MGNTIAIVANSSTNFAPAYFYGNNSTPSHPKAFFNRPFPPGYKYWPNKAFFVGTNLYVTLSIIDTNSGASLNIGTDIARITNPTSAPGQWNIEYFNLSVGVGTNADVIWFGTEALTSFSAPTDLPTYNLSAYQGNYVLMYGYYVNGGVGFPIAILIPNLALATTPNGGYLTNSQYPILRLANNNGSPVWASGLINPAGFDYYDINQNDPYGALTDYAGYSVRYNSNLGLWQLVSVLSNGGIAQYPATNATPAVWLGSSAIGPFSLARPVNFTFPELPQTSPWNLNIPPSFGSTAWQQTQCYGVREWQADPNQEHDSTLYFTYTVASTDPNINVQDNLMYENYTGGAPNPFYNSGGGYPGKAGLKIVGRRTIPTQKLASQQTIRLRDTQSLLPTSDAEKLLRMPDQLSFPRTKATNSIQIPIKTAAQKLKVSGR